LAGIERKSRMHKGGSLSQIYQGLILRAKLILFDYELWYEADYQIMLGDFSLAHGFPDKAYKFYMKAYAYYFHLQNLSGRYLPTRLTTKMADLKLKLRTIVESDSFGEASTSSFSKKKS